MKIRSLILSVMVLGALASPVYAAEMIAVVNIQEIMHSSTAAQSIKEQLEAKQKAFQSQMSKKEDDLQKEDQDLAKQRAVLSPDAFDKKLKDFKAKATIAQKEVQAKRTELDNAFSSALADIQKAVYDIVANIAKEKGYNVVLPNTQLLYSDANLDITKDVLAKLNSTLPKVTVNFKATSTSTDE